MNNVKLSMSSYQAFYCQSSLLQVLVPLLCPVRVENPNQERENLPVGRVRVGRTSLLSSDPFLKPSINCFQAFKIKNKYKKYSENQAYLIIIQINPYLNYPIQYGSNKFNLLRVRGFAHCRKPTEFVINLWD